MNEITITAQPEGVGFWVRDVLNHRDVLATLTVKDFRTRYKRASLGLLWAVAVPTIQAAVMALVFSRVTKFGSGTAFPVYVLSGVLAYSYFASTLPVASQAIVEGAALNDKVWFPRGLLVLVPCLSNLVGLGVTLLATIAAMAPFGATYGPNLLWLVPGLVTLVLFTVALSMTTAALYVYFRDVRFIVQAALTVWLYVTPIVYPQRLLGRWAFLEDVNPLTGIVTMFHLATAGAQGPWLAPVLVSAGMTVVLAGAAVWAHSRHDRVFVDLL